MNTDSPWRRLPRRLVPGCLAENFALRLLVALATLILVVSLFGGFLYVNVDAELKEDTKQELVTNADIQAANLDEWFARMEVQIISLSESASFQTDDQEQISVHLWDIVERDPQIIATYYVDTRTGDVKTSAGQTAVLSTDAALRGQGLDRLVDAARAADTGVTVSEPFRPFPESSPVLLFSSGVSNQPTRAVVTVVDLRALSNELLHGINDAEFVVVDGEDTIVMAEGDEHILDSDSLDSDTYDGDEGYLRTDDSGESSVAVGYASLQSRDWTVTARIPTEQAFALRTEVSRGILGMLLVALGCMLAIGLTFGRNTVGSVRQLANSAGRLQRGNLETPIESSRRDEFGDLFDAFDTMREALGDEIERVERARMDAVDAREAAEHARQESEELTAHLERKADEYGDVMARCANGDLSRRIDPDSHSEAMVEIAESFNRMMDDVQAQNVQLEEMTSILSHDLRNPLNVAVGRIQLLAEEANSPHVEPIERALERMETILDDALVLALQSKVAEVQRVDLREQAWTAWDHVETGDASLVVEETCTIAADPDLLAHVFENLFRNAVEHAGPGVTVTIGPGTASFYVADDGPGISENRREDIFEAGYTTNKSDGGTGFGLAIVYKVATTHDWDVRVTSSESGGARFEFEWCEPAAPHCEAGSEVVQ